MDLWQQGFLWLLGFVGTLGLGYLNSLVQDVKQLKADVRSIKDKVVVDEEVQRRLVERSNEDRRRDVVEFMGLDNRAGTERRTDGWPKSGA